MLDSRRSCVERKTSETEITVALDLDNGADRTIETGLPFLDHMLTAFAFHAGASLTLKCRGDTFVDDHHTVEDCALTLGQALREALGDRKGLIRFGHAYVPMDETLVRAVIDFSNRPVSVIELPFRRSMIGQVATENIVHFFKSLAVTAGATLHVDCIRSENDHHLAEAAFKALGRAVAEAVALKGILIPSTKGVL